MPRRSCPQRCGLRRVAAAWAVALACAAALAHAGCADADRAEPETKRFPYGGDLVNVRAYGSSVEIVELDERAGGGRASIRVTRWFDKRFGMSGDGPAWELAGDGTLNLRAGCAGVANCEAKFRVEVPAGMRVLRDGELAEPKRG